MSTLTTANTIGDYFEVHLVALWVCVEWRAIVHVVELLAFGELCYCEFTQRLGGSEGVLPVWGFKEEWGGVDNHILDSQLQKVILHGGILCW